jgi:hypothetical protein
MSLVLSDQEVLALKVEIREAIIRKLEHDRRDGDHKIAIGAVAGVLCEVISAGARDEAHRQSLIAIVTAMLQSCTKPRGKS